MTASRVTNEDVEALRSLTEHHVGQVRTGDWGGRCATFHPDVVRMPPDQTPVEGRNSVAQWLKSFPRVIHVDLELEPGCGLRSISGLLRSRGKGQMAECMDPPPQLAFGSRPAVHLLTDCTSEHLLGSPP
jgi:hypothetical protein